MKSLIKVVCFDLIRGYVCFTMVVLAVASGQSNTGFRRFSLRAGPFYCTVGWHLGANRSLSTRGEVSVVYRLLVYTFRRVRPFEPCHLSAGVKTGSVLRVSAPWTRFGKCLLDKDPVPKHMSSRQSIAVFPNIVFCFLLFFFLPVWFCFFFYGFFSSQFFFSSIFILVIVSMCWC